MHILLAGLYSVTLWLSILAYLAILGGDWLLHAALGGPFIISAIIVLLIALEAAVAAIARRLP